MESASEVARKSTYIKLQVQNSIHDFLFPCQKQIKMENGIVLE